MHADRRWEVVYVGILDVNEPVSSLKSSLYVQQAVATEKKKVFFLKTKTNYLLNLLGIREIHFRLASSRDGCEELSGPYPACRWKTTLSCETFSPPKGTVSIDIKISCWKGRAKPDN